MLNITNNTRFNSFNYASQKQLALSNVFFRSTPLYDVNIKKINSDRTTTLVPAKVTLLDINDPTDQAAVQKLTGCWPHNRITALITNFFHHKSLSDFFAIELDNPKLPLFKRILSLAACEAATHGVKDDGYEVKYIQSSPKSIYGEKDREYKGSGKLLMYGVCKHALDEDYSSVSLYSTNHDFYDAIGMPQEYQQDKGYRIFQGNTLFNFLSKTEREYNFSPDVKHKSTLKSMFKHLGIKF